MSNKPQEVINDMTFLSGYMDDLLSKFPSVKPVESELVKFLVAGNNKNYRDVYGPAKNTVTARWNQYSADVPVDKENTRKRCYRELLLEVIGKSLMDFDVEYARYLESKDVEYPHEVSPKPSKTEVLNLVSSQEKSVAKQLLELLPFCSEKEFVLIDADRATL